MCYLIKKRLYEGFILPQDPIYHQISLKIFYKRLFNNST